MCIFISIINYISRTVHFRHEPYPDFQTFLESSLLPDTTHTPLPVHDFLPERYLAAVILNQSLHAIQPSDQPSTASLLCISAAALHQH